MNSGLVLDKASNVARCAVAVADAALEALASPDPPAIQRSTMHGGMVASMNYPCIVRLSDSHPTHLGCVGVATGPVGHDLIHVRFPGRGGITLAPTEGMVPGPWEPTPERIAAAQAAGVRRGDGGASRMHAAAAAAEEGEEYGTGGEYGDGSYGDCPANTEAPPPISELQPPSNGE